MQVPSEDLVAAARKQLGPTGLHLPTVGLRDPFPMSLQVEAVQRLERAGYRAVWSGEGVGGKDGFVEMAIMLAATTDLVVGSAIANMLARPAETTHGAASTLIDAFPGRFVLGLGAGYPIQATALGREYGRPLATMREYVGNMLTPQHEMIPARERAYPFVIGANGQKMIGLAGEVTDGAHPVVIPPHYTAEARSILGPDKLLIIGLPAVIATDRETARPEARALLSGALSFPGSPYAANLVRIGYTQEEIAGAPDRLLDAIVAYGGPDDVAAKVREHIDAGADHVLITPMTQDYRTGIEQLEWIAPTVTRP